MQDFKLSKVRFWWWHEARWTLMNLSGWEIKRSQESRYCVGENTRKCDVHKRNKSVEMAPKQLNLNRRAAELVYLAWGRRIIVQDPHWYYCICISVWEQKVAVKVWHIIRGSFPLSAQRFVGKEKFMICYDEMDERMGCKMPWVLRQHPLPTLYTSCLGQGEERDIRAGPQRHFALPLFLFTCYFCMTLIMKLKTLIQLQAAILGSIASSPDTGITIFQASNLL